MKVRNQSQRSSVKIRRAPIMYKKYVLIAGVIAFCWFQISLWAQVFKSAVKLGEEKEPKRSCKRTNQPSLQCNLLTTIIHLSSMSATFQQHCWNVAEMQHYCCLRSCKATIMWILLNQLEKDFINQWFDRHHYSRHKHCSPCRTSSDSPSVSGWWQSGLWR